MSSMLQKAFLWCVLTTLLSSITNAKPLNTDGLRRLSVWLQSRVKRDAHSQSDLAALLTQKNSDTESFVPQHRSVRVRRTEPASVKRVEKAGCLLSTCFVHEFAHLLNMMQTKTSNAPPEKISSTGYGRRRRRSLPPNQPVITFHEGRLKLAWIRPVRKGN